MHKRRITWNNSWDSVLGLLHHSTKRTDGSRADDNWFKTIATIHRKTDTKAQSDHKSNTVAVLRGRLTFSRQNVHMVYNTHDSIHPVLVSHTRSTSMRFCEVIVRRYMNDNIHIYAYMHERIYNMFLYTCIHSRIHTDMHETRMNICIKTKIRK